MSKGINPNIYLFLMMFVHFSWWSSYAVLCFAQPFVFYFMYAYCLPLVSDKILFEESMSIFFWVSTIVGLITCVAFSVIFENYKDSIISSIAYNNSKK